MPQGDLNVSNQSGAAFRADMNNQLLALGTMQSGAAEPTPSYAYQMWADTTNGLLKQRNGSNNAWLTIGTLDTANWGLATTTGSNATGTWPISVSGSSAQLNGISSTGLFNNMGQTHGTRSSFDATTPSYDFGFRYIQGGGNGPGTGGSQFYSLYMGLGSEYPATGASSYGMYLAIDRNTASPYLSVRYNENNSLSTWRKINAGYADLAGAVQAGDGSVSAPSLAFANDTDTGIYRTGTGAIAIASDGANGVRFGNATDVTSELIKIPARNMTGWNGGGYFGYWSNISFAGVDRDYDFIGVYYEANTYNQSYGRNVGANSYFTQICIGATIPDTSGLANEYGAHSVVVQTSRPDGEGTRRRVEVGQNGLIYTNYHDYPGLASTTNTNGNLGPAFFCRAWVNFNGTGTPSIRKSGNVSSITDVGVGNYYVNFTASMPDLGFSVQGTEGWDISGATISAGPSLVSRAYVGCFNASAVNFDSANIQIAIFR